MSSIMSFQKSYVETWTHNVTMFGNSAFTEMRTLNEVQKVGPSLDQTCVCLKEGIGLEK